MKSGEKDEVLRWGCYMEGDNNRVVKRSLLFHPIKARSHSAPYARSYNSESMLQKPRVITRTGHPSASSQ